MIDPSAPNFEKRPGRDRPGTGLLWPADPIISIITPFRDALPHFEETLKSVSRQSYQQWEWIIVDDCSTDPSARPALLAAASSDPRIKIFRNQSCLGPAASRNKAARQAAAPFIFQLDADDLIEPTCLEKMLWYLHSHSGDAMVTSFNVGFGRFEYLWRGGLHERERFLDRNLNTIMTMMRAEAFHEAGAYDESIKDGYEDWDFWLRMARAGNWGGTIPEFLTWYRRGDFERKWRNWDEGEKTQRFRESLAKKYPELFEVFPGEPKKHWSTEPGIETSNMLLDPLDALLISGASAIACQNNENLPPKSAIILTGACSESELSKLCELTPEVFVLPNFLRDQDFSAFIAYFEASRRPIRTIRVEASPD